MTSCGASGRWSRFGDRFTQHTGIMELMDDLGQAMTVRPDLLMLGGGNPAPVPEVQALWRTRTSELLADGDKLDRLLVNYDPPQGNPQFLAEFADLLCRDLGWPISAENVAVTAGTQTALFFLFNLLAGDYSDGPKRRILLPMAPEYIGYADQGLDADLFVACRPTISWPAGEGGHRFRYHVDLAAVEQRLSEGDIAAVAVSRPTNPSGNVLDDTEIAALTTLTEQAGVPLIVDGAYGVPFPGIVFGPARAQWAPHVVHTFSLSKLGLPGTRTGLVVGSPDLIAAIASLNAVVGLANGNLGQRLALPLVQSGELLTVGERWLRPFYEARSVAAQEAAAETIGLSGRPWALHASLGAFFLWLWMPDLPISTRQLYARLKDRGVLVVPGEYFFYGLDDEPWRHRQECLRLSFSQSPEVVHAGLTIIADELRRLG